MEKHKGENQDKCPVAYALDTFGDKWSLLVLRDILFKSKRRYGEFLQSPEQISTNILANRLQKLEAEGVITKFRDPINGTKQVYSLTQKGKDLVPVVLEMINWSAKYNPQPQVADCIIDGAPSDLLNRAREDRHALVEEIVSNLDRATGE